tara:strand:- start:336 stop:839 length:504 start_codon:yes stop_codon:yes gene_type:complete
MPPSELGSAGEQPASGLGLVQSPKIKRVFDFWASLRRDRPFPAWTDVRLMDLYDVAPFLAVVDVEQENGARRFRYRFCGTSLVEARSRLVPADPTGRCIDEVVWPFDPAPLVGACAKVVDQRRPTLLAVGAVNESAYHLHERVFFPLGSDDGAVSNILICVDEVRAM